MTRSVFILLGLSSLVGCGLDVVEPGSVLTVVSCLDDQPCTTVADGASQLTVTACTEAEDRPKIVEVELETSAGTWAGTTLPVTTERMSLNGCATATLVVPRTPGTIRLDARSGDSTSEPLYVELGAVEPELVELQALPAFLSDDGTQASISARVFADSGRPSRGTLIMFEAVAIEPADAFVDVRPRFVEMRDLDDVGEATLIVEDTVTEVEVTATVTHSATPGTATESMVVRRL